MCVSNEPKSFCSGTAKYAVQKVTKSCANTKFFSRLPDDMAKRRKG